MLFVAVSMQVLFWLCRVDLSDRCTFRELVVFLRLMLLLRYFPPETSHWVLGCRLELQVTILAALGSIGLVWLQYDSATGRLCPDG